MSTRDLIAQLGTDDHAAATEALISLGESAVTPLCEALSDPSWRVAAGAAFTLGKIGSQEAAAPLVLTLKIDRFFVREAVVWALGQIGGAASVAAIFELLRYNVASAYDTDLVAVSAEAIGRHPAEAAPFLDSFIDREGLAASHNTALELLSRLPDELAIAPLVLIMCFSECYFESAESALGQIGFPTAKVLIDLLFNPSEEVKKCDYTDGAIAALIEINDVRVVDLLMDHVQEDIARYGKKYILTGLSRCEHMPGISGGHYEEEIMSRRQYGRRITERLLEIAINPRSEEESAEVWDWLDTLLDSKYSHFYVDDVYSHRSLIPSYRYLPEPLNRIVQTVIDKHNADSDSDEELKDAVLQALTAVAAISKAEEASEPQPLQRETSKPLQQSGEELISAMLNGQNPILKALEGQSSAEAVQSLFRQAQKANDDLGVVLPLVKAMTLIGPEAIESLCELRRDYDAVQWSRCAQMALEAMNIPALGADAVPSLLHTLRQFLGIDAPKALEEIWKYLVAVGPAALPGLEDEIRIAHRYYAYGVGSTEIPSKEKINIHTLFDIREEIMEAYNVVLDASSESLLDDFAQAIQYGDIQYVKRFVIANPDLIHMDINGKKALEIAVTRDESEDTDFHRFRAEMIEMLLKQGADINAQNQEGNTALHLAVMRYCSDNGDNSYETLLCLLQFEPVLTVENNEAQTAWDEAADRDVERACFWLGEAEQLQHANKMKIKRIKYTLVETDEEIEVRDIAAFDWKGESIALADHVITSYQNYFLGRRNYYGGLGDYDDNPVGQLVWDVSRREIEPAPNLKQL